jgi:lipoate-protein ligase B
MKILHVDIGLTHFKAAWEIQKTIYSSVRSGNSRDVIITTEHYPVYTLGKTGLKDHLLLNADELESQGIDYFEIDRGGDITYHGPGQLVVYPIFDLNHYYKDTHRFLRDLEETVILTLSEYNIKGYRDEQFTGVWVGQEKICAIGIKVSRWVTMHGLAFNVNNDLHNFDKIIPCGIFHKGVTSMKKLLNTGIEMKEVRKKLIMNMEKIFGVEAEEIMKDILLSKIISEQEV